MLLASPTWSQTRAALPSRAEPGAWPRSLIGWRLLDEPRTILAAGGNATVRHALIGGPRERVLWGGHVPGVADGPRHRAVGLGGEGDRGRLGRGRCVK